jgi:hypothetical protein
MTDLIERLRRAPAAEVLDLNLYEEAADKIEQLRETLKTCEYEFVCLIPRVTEPYRTTLDGVLAVIRKALKGV